MSRKQTSKNVPPDDVEFTVKQFRREGAVQILVTKNNGTYDIEATFES